MKKVGIQCKFCGALDFQDIGTGLEGPIVPRVCKSK